jgi:hypothetical protein
LGPKADTVEQALPRIAFMFSANELLLLLAAGTTGGSFGFAAIFLRLERCSVVMRSTRSFKQDISAPLNPFSSGIADGTMLSRSQGSLMPPLRQARAIFSLSISAPGKRDYWFAKLMIMTCKIQAAPSTCCCFNQSANKNKLKLDIVTYCAECCVVSTEPIDALSESMHTWAVCSSIRQNYEIRPEIPQI